MSRHYLFGVIGCVLGILIALFSGRQGTVAAQGSSSGRYAINTVQWEGNRALVIVLDTATGNIQPYFHGGTHSGLSFFPIEIDKR